MRDAEVISHARPLLLQVSIGIYVVACLHG
jgi:hypothetical protein